jgi:hypothetical protein
VISVNKLKGTVEDYAELYIMVAVFTELQLIELQEPHSIAYYFNKPKAHNSSARVNA